ncbi:AAA family ATPase [uncultured Sulfitobacter sp.]|uniref:AAA family ATPase n=1 Tax=uncultured Sulfitobacter sp. TaxID=191468 RepID=UPI0034507EF6
MIGSNCNRSPADQMSHRIGRIRMQIHHLILQNFKGFEHFQMKLNSRFTLIVGRNGVGKSSIV